MLCSQWGQFCEASAESGSGERVFAAAGGSDRTQAAAALAAARCSDVRQRSARLRESSTHHTHLYTLIHVVWDYIVIVV